MKKTSQPKFLVQPIAISLSVLILSVGCSSNSNNEHIGGSNSENYLSRSSAIPHTSSQKLNRTKGVLPESAAQPIEIAEADASVLSQIDKLQTNNARDNASLSKPTTTLTDKIDIAWDVSEPPKANTEKYQSLTSNPVIRVAQQSTSTFSIDVDTGAYSNVRRFINTGQLPPTDAVRVEELLNYFRYDYATPTTQDVPFSIHTELASNPWNPNTRLLHIGLKGYNVDTAERPPANLVFLLDVSGSMGAANKLGLLKSSIKLLVKDLTENDRVSIVVYAGATGVVLEPTAGNDSRAIKHALRKLNAGGATNGQAGIELAYTLAEQSMSEGSINRIILATDGDFNVGVSNIDTLKKLIEQKRESGIALTTLGFGAGNYNDYLMEQLADVGNGSYAYIDTLSEARKVLSEELTSTLLTIAKDVKIQIEFNPAQVSEYRLIGYVNRRLANEDFANDKVDAGEIGAGHTVTALYEVALTGEGGEWNTALRYQNQTTDTPNSNEVAEVRLRYKRPNENKSQLIERIISRSDLVSEMADASENFRFSAAVAGFGQLLRQNKYLTDFDYSDAAELASSARGKDRFGYRNELVRLIDLADNLDPRNHASVKMQDKLRKNNNEG